jgi:glycosyltransferase involved in cell wall biosynthesis
MVSATYDADVVNGVLRMIELYRRHLPARGHEVTIFTLGSEDPEGTPGVVRSPGLPLGDHGYYAGLGYTPEAQRQLAQMDIVHCHHLLMSLEMAHRYADAPIVYTNHTRYDLYTGSYTRLPQPAADAIMRYAWPRYTDMADHIIAPSVGMLRVMLEFNVRRPISVIENGIELEPFLRPSHPRTKRDLGLPDDCVLAVYCGRLAAEKDVALLVTLFAEAAAQHSDLALLLIGKGPQASELRRQVEALGLAERVRFTGALPYAAVGAHLAAADMFLTASTSEVHPLTVIEAMAAGLPVVAVRSPGLAETVESGVTGLLVPAADLAFVAAMLSLAGDAAARRRMGAAAREAAHRYDIGRTIDRTLALYDDLLTRRPDRGRRDPHGWWRRRAAAWESRLSEIAHVLQLEPGRAPLDRTKEEEAQP